VKMGEYADLWIGMLNGTEKVAVKLLRGGSSTNPKFMTDLQNNLNRNGEIWKQLRHPNVAEFRGFVFGWGYMPGIVLSLYDITVVEFVEKNFNPEKRPNLRVEMARQVAEGLAFLHSKDLVHGDLRGANVLMDDKEHPRICDCGLTFIIEPSEFTSVKTAGACRWTAPELMDPSEAAQNDPHALFTAESDVYAFAMLVIELFTGKIPFSNKKNDSSVIFAVLDGGRPDMPSSISEIPALKTLIESCWHTDPKQRPTAREAADKLSNIESESASQVTGSSWLGRWIKTRPE